MQIPTGIMPHWLFVAYKTDAIFPSLRSIGFCKLSNIKSHCTEHQTLKSIIEHRTYAMNFHLSLVASITTLRAGFSQELFSPLFFADFKRSWKIGHLSRVDAIRAFLILLFQTAQSLNEGRAYGIIMHLAHYMASLRAHKPERYLHIRML